MQDYNNGPEIQNSGAMQMARTQTIVDTCWLMLSRLMICNANDSDQKKTRPMSISTFNKLNKDHNPHKKPKKKSGIVKMMRFPSISWFPTSLSAKLLALVSLFFSVKNWSKLLVKRGERTKKMKRSLMVGYKTFTIKIFWVYNWEYIRCFFILYIYICPQHSPKHPFPSGQNSCCYVACQRTHARLSWVMAFKMA